MNRGKYGRTTLSVVLVAVMALVLQGCGGDDNNGMEQDLRDQVAMLEGQLSDAETAKAAADAARMTAEAAATDAMTAQTAAEAERDAANIAKGAAEQAQATAEATQMTAEEAQMAAEAAQMTAEAAQTEAEKMQAAAEAERDAASGSLAAAEMARDAAKDAEAAAKVAQAHAEAAKMSAEADSADAMVAQMAAEAAQMVAEEAQMAAEAAQMAADAKAADYKMMADDATAAQAAADVKAAEYKMMADDAETARMAAVEAQKDAEDKAADYKMMADDAEAARMAAVEAQKDAEDKAEMYRQRVAELEGKAGDDDTATSIDMAKKLNDALMGGGVMPPTATDDTAAMQMIIVKTLTASTDGVLAVTLRHMDGTASKDLDGYEMGDMPDEIDGWRGVTLTKDNAMAVVYSDIEDTAGGRFDARYNASLDDERMKQYRLDTATDLDAEDAVSLPGLIMLSAARLDMEPVTVTGTGVGAKNSYMGGVHDDVPGTFSCVVTDTLPCGVLTRQSDGKIDVDDVARAAAWYFMPTDPDAMISTVVDDMYLTLGWWLDRGDGTEPYYFDAFAAATGMSKNGDNATTTAVETELAGTVVGPLQGTATYDGDAAGKYTILDADADTAEGGHFTASAMLEANFDVALAVDTAPATTGVRITGMIDNFMTGAVARPGWEVELMAGDGDGQAEGMQNYSNLNSGVTGSTEWTMGGAANPATGDWAADVYDGGMNDYPDAMTGTFDASGIIGRISGAFGAMEE